MNNRPLTIFLCGLLFLSLFPMTPTGAVDDNRDLYDSMTFTEAGVNKTISFELPKGTTVTKAKLTLEGKVLEVNKRNETHDYSDIGNNDAYEGETTDVPVVDDPVNLMDIPFDQDGYDSIAHSDGYIETHHLNNRTSISAYQLFRIKVPTEEPKELEVLWEGWGWGIKRTSGGGQSLQLSARVVVWEPTGSRWVSVGNYNNLPGKHIISKVFDDHPGDLIDNQGYVTVVVQGLFSQTSEATTDYVCVNITYSDMMYPTDPSLDVGDDGKIEWDHSGELMVSETVDIKEAVQDLLDAAGRGQGTVNVVLAISSGSAGVIDVHDLEVEYVVPRAPVWSAFTHVLWDEDHMDTKLDLLDHITDDRPEDELDFEVIYISDDENVNAVVHGDGYHELFLWAEDDWWGTAKVWVKATDLDELETEVEIDIVVNPVNDPPDIEDVNDVTVSAGVPFSYNIKASDIDMGLDRNETLSFYDDTDLFDIDPESGNIRFTALKEDIGEHHVDITVSDREGQTCTTVMRLTIEPYNGDRNTPPTLEAVGEIIVKEDEKMIYQVKASDVDLVYGDQLSFDIDRVFPSNIDEEPVFFSIDEKNGTLTLSPTEQDLGSHLLRITVTDSKAASSSRLARIVVENTNDIPEVTYNLASNVTFNITVGEGFHESVLGWDPDLFYDPAESLTYSDDTKLFDIDPETGEFDLVPEEKDIGTHRITIKVKDHYGKEDVLKMTLIVEEAPDDKKDGRDKDDRDNGAIVGFEAGLVLVALLVGLYRRPYATSR